VNGLVSARISQMVEIGRNYGNTFGIVGDARQTLEWWQHVQAAARS
jgi:hypothetical protein